MAGTLLVVRASERSLARTFLIGEQIVFGIVPRRPPNMYIFNAREGELRIDWRLGNHIALHALYYARRALT
jgi:hypothetical protein